MYFSLACIACIVNQSYKMCQIFGISDAEVQKEVIHATMKSLLDADTIRSAPHFSKVLDAIIGEKIDVANIIDKVKRENINKIKPYLKFLEIMYKAAAEKFEIAVRYAIVGNAIDIGANPDFNLEQEINKITSANIELSLLQEFKQKVIAAESILYIADNYEEAVFDKFLLNELKDKNVVFAVRSKPILNDITIENAIELGIDKVCRVIESGSEIAGTDLSECSKEFVDLFNNSDVVISKGQGNYETLLDVERDVFFLFKVKCRAISEKSGVRLGNGVVLYKEKNGGINASV